MRLLRSPAVTGVLVLIALGVVIYQVMQGTHGRGGAPTSSASRPATTASSPAATLPASVAHTTSPKAGPIPQAGMDRGRIGMSFRGWVAAPAHDPFDLRKYLTPKKAPRIKGPDALAKLKLNGLFLQKGSPGIATINGHQYTEGDTIEGYRIVSIDADTVWFQSPDSSAHLTFEKPSPVRIVNPPPAVETNAPPPLAPEKEEARGPKPQ